MRSYYIGRKCYIFFNLYCQYSHNRLTKIIFELIINLWLAPSRYLSWIIGLILLFSSVLAKKFVSGNITEQVMINGNHKRQYWNLNDTNESIGLNLTYLGSESAWQNKLPTMVQIFYKIDWLNWLRFWSWVRLREIIDLLAKLSKFTKSKVSNSANTASDLTSCTCRQSNRTVLFQ